ncbi:hypothetical protein GSI_15179 [Ganoderma sinense ZZ0214-1]|uniref:Chromatin modification-related protein EAF7 n=1 Tax=Ganoderma sinense ZZ0214-1 TaxID=1077348 RepID=A0A2G8RLW1_9APHY|nr:hypothetical protein GSI_15179 [Ganoderma sinense ZZ0214-1]
MATSMEVDEPEAPWLDTVEGEIAFFRSLTRARPVGIHKHFHVLTMRNAILRDTGKLVEVDDLWKKLRACYDLDNLENIVSEPLVPPEADGYDVPGESHAGTPPFQQPASPSPADNIFNHPFFRGEYSLPADEMIDQLVSARRMRASASLPSSSPAPSPAATKSGRGGRKGKSKLKVMAGLVGGDSDSSALTQESGDESVAPTPRDSVATGTDAGTEYAEEEEEPRQSPAASIASKQPRRGKGKRGSSTGRGGRGGSKTRGTKKKK